MYRNNLLWMPRTVSVNFGSGPVSAIRRLQIGVSSWPNSVSIVQDSRFGVDGICRRIITKAPEIDLVYDTNLAPTILSAEEYQQNREY